MEFPSQNVSKTYSILFSAKFEPFSNPFRCRAQGTCGTHLLMTWLVSKTSNPLWRRKLVDWKSLSVSGKKLCGWSFINPNNLSSHTEGTGLIRDSVASSNNLVPRGTKVSAIAVTVKAIFERLYLVLGLTPIYAPSQLSLCTHTPTAHSPAISRFPWDFLPSGPLIFWSARFAK